jgi:membrane associated rhomboid family serine protease
MIFGLINRRANITLIAMQGMFQSNPVASVIFFATIVTSLLAFQRDSELRDKFILHPWGLIRGQRIYSIIMHGFIHADYMHLAFNMITFYFFAFYLEVRTGHLNFFIIYFGSLIISVLSTIYKHKNDFDYRSLGASGAVSGVILSAVIYEPASRIYLFFFPIGIPSPIFALLYIGYSYYASKNRYGNIAHEAHLWGAIAGIALTILLDPNTLVEFFYKVF